MNFKSKVIVVCYFILCLYLEHFPFPIVLKFLERHMLQLLLKMDDGNTLPDLNNEKTSEQIVFEQKVFRANEVFMKLHQDIINWYLSPTDKRSYPKTCIKTKMVSD